MRINSAFITPCLAVGTLGHMVYVQATTKPFSHRSLTQTLRSKHGIATHWYPTGQPGPCQYVPEAVHQSFQNLLLNTIHN